MASIEHLTKKMEQDCRDELGLLASVGPEFYNNADLIRLLGQWETRRQLFGQLQGALIIIGASSPGWLAVGALLSIIKLPTAASMALLMAPVAVMVFLGGLFWIKKSFRGEGHLEQTGEMIKHELHRRELAQKYY